MTGKLTTNLCRSCCHNW